MIYFQEFRRDIFSGSQWSYRHLTSGLTGGKTTVRPTEVLRSDRHIRRLNRMSIEFLGNFYSAKSFFFFTLSFTLSVKYGYLCSILNYQVLLLIRGLFYRIYSCHVHVLCLQQLELHHLVHY